MTEEQVVMWLGLPWPLPGGRRLRPEIAEALAPLPWPATDSEQMAVWTRFLSVAGPAPRMFTHPFDREEAPDGREPG